MRLVPCLLASWLAISLAVAQRPPSGDASDLSGTPTGDVPKLAPCLFESEPEAPPPAPESAPVPEPSTLLLVGTGLVGIALTARRRRKTS